MEVVGITGGVGSGKSTISRLLEKQYKAYIIDTDEIAHNLMKKKQTSYNLIVKHFGRTILQEDGEINRSRLGSIVYKDEKELKVLNSFSHPYVMEEVKNIIKSKAGQDWELICVETALPVEADLKAFCDRILYIYTPKDLRIERLKSKRNYSEEKTKDIMARQLSEEEYKDYATDVIMNVSSKDNILNQIDRILKGKDIGAIN